MKEKTRVERYIPLAKAVATEFIRRRGRGVYLEFNDILSACYEGLLIADKKCSSGDVYEFVFEARRQMSKCASRVLYHESSATNKRIERIRGSLSIDAVAEGCDGLGLRYDDSKEIDSIIIRADIEVVLKKLDDVRRNMFIDYYYNDMNTREVGAKYGVTHQTVSNIMARIIRIITNEKALTK